MQPKIITNGLAFCIDEQNTSKSFIGKPTTNLVSDASGFTGWSNYYRTTSNSTFITEFGTTGYRFSNQPSWNGIYRSITLPSTGTYTFSAYYRHIGGSPSNNGGTVYVSGYGVGDVASGINKNILGSWQRVSHTINATTTTGTFYLISYGGTDNGTGIPDWSSQEITMPQVEAGSFATTFVNGTRSNTQAIHELVSKRTLTANNLVYNSNNTFSFNGTDSSINFSTTGFDMAAGQTIIIVLKPTEADANRRNPYNHEYAGWGTITHETAGNFHYFHGTSGGNGATYQGTLSSFTVAQNETAMITVSRGTSTVRWYKNGVFVNSATNSYPIAVNSVTTANIGSGYAGPSFQGDIKFVALYNRQLTDQEVSENFNALRGRYGL